MRGLRHALLALCVAMLASACGTLQKAVKPAPSSKYYSDDGPPEAIPENLDAIPNAVPHDEPFHRYANRPYTVFGRTYVPVVNKDPIRQRGIASWYGRKFHGQKTASGEPYDMFAMTAAHPTFPIPSYARVTNLKTGQWVVVRINDRGPFHSNRVIDLSYAAAARIGLASAGSGMVEVERVFESWEPPPAAAVAETPPPAPVVETPVVVAEASGLWLQLGAFSSRESAESFRDHATRELSWNHEPVQVAPREGLYRVRLGPYRNRDEALAIADKVRETLGFAPTLTSR
ncbi:MAG: septal ring lytic transglycosylase RlpA family protein [Usitatibacter sp.]